MSPRTPQNRRPRRPSHLSLAPSPVGMSAAEPATDMLPGNLVRLLLTQAESLVDEDDPIQAELWCSDVLGAVWATTDGDSEAETTFTSAWMAAVTGEGEAALCTLSALSLLAGSATLRREAGAAAERLIAQGVRLPRWAEAAAGVEIGECWRYGDVFGDQETILCSFGRAHGGDHAMLVLIDHTLGGLAKDVFFTDAVAGSIADLQQELDATPVTFLEPIEPAAARRRLHHAFTVTDELLEPRINDDLAPHRAMALARLRALPSMPEDLPVPGPRLSPDVVLDEFFGSGEASELPDTDLTRRWVRLLVDRAAERDDAPTRVGPGMLDELLLVDVPDHALLDAAARQAMPAVLNAWIRWAGRRQDLSAVAAEWLQTALDEILEEFPEAYRAPDAVAHRNSCPDVVDLRTPRAAHLTVTRSRT